jgi:long-chain acyl-CoA synthetase
MLKRDEVAFALNDCGARVLVTTAELRAEVLDAQLVAPLRVVIAEGVASGDLTLSDLVTCESADFRAALMERDDPAAIVYTSGTTGFPKGATLSHGNVISSMSAKQHYCGTQPDDRLLLFLPLFHCFGQNAILNHSLHAGATVVLQRRFEPINALEAITEHGITMFFGVPTVYIKLLNMQLPATAFKSVRYYFAAGATMPVEIARRWAAEYGRMIYEGYGLTETSPFASYNHAEYYKFGSVGVPIEGVEMQVIDAAGQPVADGERGEIVIRGPNVMLGYWNRPSETAQVLRNGWFHTGDIGIRDADGYYQIVDRLKDMISVAGFKVYPTEVENAMYQHPAVAEVAVYGVPDAVQGELVKASIVLKPYERVSANEIIAFCRDRIATFKVPRTIEFVETIPKNPTGKILRRALRATA